MDRQVIGIDFGTTFSSVSYMPIGSHEPPHMLQFSGARFHVPTLVSVDPDEGTLVDWGWDAQRSLASPHRNLVKRHFKRTLGDASQSSEFVLLYLSALNANIREKKGNLSKLDSKEFITAIGAPANWSSAQRDLLKNIAEQAGFPEVRVIEEPVAAMHNLRCKPGIKFAFGDSPETFMVIDFGGGTLDICVVKTQELGRNPVVLAVEGDAKLGGMDFDDLLQKWFLKQSEIDIESLSPREKFHLIEQIQTYKENMSSVFRKTDGECVHEEKIHLDAGAYTFETTKNEFKNRCMEVGFIEKIKTALDRALEKCRLREKDIKRVILTGGSCGFHFVRQIAAERLGLGSVNELLETDTPFTDVANGLSVCIGLSPDPPARDGAWLDFRFAGSKQWERKILLSPGRVSRVAEDRLFLGDILGSRKFVRATLEFSWWYGRSEKNVQSTGSSTLKVHLRSNRPTTQVLRNLVSVIRHKEVKALSDTYSVFMVTREPNDLQGISYCVEIQNNRGETTSIPIGPNQDLAFGALGYSGLTIRLRKPQYAQDETPQAETIGTSPIDAVNSVDAVETTQPSGDETESKQP